MLSNVVNVSYLTPTHDGSEKYPDREPPPPDPEVIEGEQHYRVEALYNHRYHHGYLQYFVKYDGYPMEQGEWLFIADMREDMDPDTIKQLVLDYRQRRTLQEELQEEANRLSPSRLLLLILLMLITLSRASPLL